MRLGVENSSGTVLVALTDSRALHGEPSALFVGQAETALAELLAEDAVLLEEILDDVVLMAVDPAGEREEKEPQRVGRGRHGAELALEASAAQPEVVPSATIVDDAGSIVVGRGGHVLRGRPSFRTPRVSPRLQRVPRICVD